MGKLIPAPPSQSPKLPAPAADGKPRVWVLRDGRAAPIEIQTGATNGQVTEVLAGTLAAGTQVITEAIGSQP
jgi:HlyD family secretion protein